MSGFFDNDESGFFSISSISFGDNVYRSVKYSTTVMPELQMPNDNLTCPRCGTTIHNVQKNRRLGCINCYTVFEGQIAKLIKLTQPDTAYLGRTKGRDGIDVMEINSEEDISENVVNRTTETEVPSQSQAVSDNSSKEISNEEKLDKLRKADLGMLSDAEIEKNMKFAASQRDYVLAGRLKEELKSRKGN
ncbi:MAG: hypothetical protein MJ153_01005 [Clostridia bacterium]|nr:hypothetical protein [Clostridia bacterium]